MPAPATARNSCRHVLQAEAGPGRVQLVAEKGQELLPHFLVGDTFVISPDQALARSPSSMAENWCGAAPPRCGRRAMAIAICARYKVAAGGRPSRAPSSLSFLFEEQNCSSFRL
jgi:hypothetical protein